MAAIELGKHDWAYWDLLLAADISPSNQEVVKKLEEVEDFIHKENSSVNIHDEKPRGLGLGLPPQKNKSNRCLGEDKFFNQGIVHEKDLIVGKKDVDRDHLGGRCKDKESGSSSNIEIISSDVYQGSCDKENGKDVKMEDAGNQDFSSDLSSSITNEFDTLSRVSNDEEIRHTDIGETYYRFRSGKRNGSRLSISKNNYELMSKGKSLIFGNSRLGSFIEIRIIHKDEGKVAGDSNYHSQEKQRPSYCVQQSKFPEVKNDNSESGEVQSEVSSCVMIGDSQLENDAEEISSKAPVLSHFCFSSTSSSKPKGKRSINIKGHSLSKVPGKKVKRRKIYLDRNCSSQHSLSDFNYVFECRSRIGMKRKNGPINVSFLHPRKKSSPCSCVGCNISSASVVLCSCSPTMFRCANGSSSARSLLHEMVFDQE